MKLEFSRNTDEDRLRDHQKAVSRLRSNKHTRTGDDRPGRPLRVQEELWPAREQIEDGLEKTGLIIDPVACPDKEEDMVRGLLALFKSFPLASILPRPVWPREHFATVFALPEALGVERGYDDIEEYFNYNNEIQRLPDIVRARADGRCRHADLGDFPAGGRVRGH